MEENKLEKQNRTLKVVLLVLLVPVVSGLSILGFYFGQKMLNPDSEVSASNDRRLPVVNRNAPYEGMTATPAATPGAANAVNAASPSPSPTAPPATPAEPSFILTGSWTFTNPYNRERMTYRFEAPRKVGNLQTGALRTTEHHGKERIEIYTVLSSTKIQFKEEGSPDSRECTYEVEVGGKSAKLTCDGNVTTLSKR